MADYLYQLFVASFVALAAVLYLTDGVTFYIRSSGVMPIAAAVGCGRVLLSLCLLASRLTMGIAARTEVVLASMYAMGAVLEVAKCGRLRYFSVVHPWARSLWCLALWCTEPEELSGATARVALLADACVKVLRSVDGLVGKGTPGMPASVVGLLDIDRWIWRPEIAVGALCVVGFSASEHAAMFGFAWAAMAACDVERRTAAITDRVLRPMRRGMMAWGILGSGEEARPKRVRRVVPAYPRGGRPSHAN